MAESSTIKLRGVRVHNLRGIDVDIPLGTLTVVTGVCGAGKSSLVFDTLFAEAQRRYLQSFSVSIRPFLERFDRPDAERIGDLPPALAVRRDPQGHGTRTEVGASGEVNDLLRLLFTRIGAVRCPNCAEPVQASRFDDVQAAVASMPAGTRVTVAFPSRPEPGGEADWVAALQEEGFVRVQVGAKVFRLGEDALPPLRDDDVWVLVDRLQAGSIAPGRLGDSVETAFRRGQDRLALLTDGEPLRFDRRLRCVRCGREFPPLQPRWLDRRDPLGACAVCHGAGFEPKSETPCSTCQGQGWSELAHSVRLGNRSFVELMHAPLVTLPTFLAELPSRVETRFLVEQLQARLSLLLELELGHLEPGRFSSTLSGGESQRLALGAALSSSLVGALYALDEPTAGLHPRDTEKVIALLKRLRDAGNTVVVVTHELDLVRAADRVIDLGPGAGEEGGTLLFQGAPAGLLPIEASATADYLAGRSAIAVPEKRRKPAGWLRLEGARLHNLRDLTVEFPLGVLAVVTGVSGAGKSSLVEQTLVPCLQQIKGVKGSAPPAGAKVQGAGQIGDVVFMDQTPLPRSARSNPATYLKVFDDIRELFAETTEAKIRNLTPGHFSFNQPGGRCETCAGQGTLAVDMQFLADVAMTCPECLGSRFRRDILDVKVRSLSIAQVLGLTVREAFRFFRAQRNIERKLKWILDVGLEYLRLGQPTETLSGGEAQRLKLAGHLASSRKTRSLFVLVEPAAGLHPADIEQLLGCFDGLLSSGHSLLLIEHVLDVIQCADHVIDLGPGAGPAGGQIVATGTPEVVAQVEASATGQCLARRFAM